MEKNQKTITDLKGLTRIINDGNQGYASAAETTDNRDLKAVFLKYADQRAAYAMELKAHIAQHGGDSSAEQKGSSGTLHQIWADIRQALGRKDNPAILGAIETAEQAAIEKYDRVLEDYAAHLDHMVLLQRQRTGILEALKEIQKYHLRLMH